MLRLAIADAPAEDRVIHHPNREKGGSVAAKAGTILLLLASAALVAIITIGGWKDLEGAQVISIFFIIVFALMAFFVARWNRGVLPLAAAFAIVLLVFAAIAAPTVVLVPRHLDLDVPLLREAAHREHDQEELDRDQDHGQQPEQAGR